MYLEPLPQVLNVSESYLNGMEYIYLPNICFFFFFSFFLLGPHLQHMGSSRLGVESEL